jgi:hypothetical protein
MPGERWTESGENWQELVVSLLKIRYAVGEFIEIPDTVRGDCGIEGFVRDGKAFQCYAAEEPLSVADLTAKQKNKISRDLGKLKNNSQKLIPILGSTRLSRWILVVPRWEDKDLHSHAEAKASEIRAASLPYIANDFAPAIVTCHDFVIERQKLVVAGKDSLRIIISDVDPGRCADWADQNDNLIGNLDRKALAICHGNRTQARKLRDEFIKHYLQGYNALEKLRDLYPELFEMALRIKNDKENFLAAESAIPDSLPPQKMREVLGAFKGELAKAMPGMSDHTRNQLVFEAVSDWLLRCPLDFPEPDNVGVPNAGQP